jgi:hypothetical protein
MRGRIPAVIPAADGCRIFISGIILKTNAGRAGGNMDFHRARQTGLRTSGKISFSELA